MGNFFKNTPLRSEKPKVLGKTLKLGFPFFILWVKKIVQAVTELMFVNNWKEIGQKLRCIEGRLIKTVIWGSGWYHFHGLGLCLTLLNSTTFLWKFTNNRLIMLRTKQTRTYTSSNICPILILYLKQQF